MGKHAYEEKLRRQVGQWQASIDRLKGRLEQASVETRVVLEQQIQDLQAKQKAARRKLKQLDHFGGSGSVPGAGTARTVLRGVRRTIEKIVTGGK